MIKEDRQEDIEALLRPQAERRLNSDFRPGTAARPHHHGMDLRRAPVKSAEQFHAIQLQSPAQAAPGFKWTALALAFVACLYASDVFAHQAQAGTALPATNEAVLSAP